MSSIYDLDEEALSAYGLSTPHQSHSDEASKTPDGRRNVQNARLSSTTTTKSRTSGTTPIRVGLFSSPSANSPVVHSASKTYASRLKVGAVVLQYNCTDSTQWKNSEHNNVSELNVQLYNSDDHLSWKDVKYMFQQTRDVASVLDSLVHTRGLMIIEDNGLESYQNLLESTSEDAVYIGRIRSDGKLTAGSIFFEGTNESSNGHVVELNLSKVDEYFIFPGQVVAIGGTNNLGKYVIVTNIFLPNPLNMMPIDKTKCKESLSILIAAGPFTPYDSSSYEPFADLLKKIEEIKPQLCILIGPFVDSSHSLIMSEIGKTDTFEDFFLKKMTQLCTPNLSTTKFVLVASCKDAHHHAVYPTPPYDVEAGLKKMDIVADNIMTVPDPATISVNGVTIGVTSVDILMHLRKNELSCSTISSDSMGRLSRHILSQRSYYPLYPPDETVPLDVGLWTQYGQIETTPHILIVPSDIRHFIKDVDKTVVVNPERLSKGNSGTFARLQLEIPDNVDEITSIADIVKGQVVKI